TLAALQKFREKEKGLHKLREDVNAKKHQKKTIEQQIKKVQQRLADSQITMQKLDRKLDAIGKIEYDAEIHDKTKKDLMHQKKILAHLHALAEESKNKSRYQKHQDQLIKDIASKQAELEKIETDISTLHYSEETHDEVKDAYLSSQKKMNAMQEKLSGTERALREARQAFLPAITTLWTSHQFKKKTQSSKIKISKSIAQKCATFINSVLAYSGIDAKNAMNGIDFQRLDDPAFWKGVHPVKKRLVQLSLSFTIRQLLLEKEIAIPNFMIFDDSMAMENSGERFRHKLVLQYLQKYYSQLIFVSHPIKHGGDLTAVVYRIDEIFSL
ncbi:MAG: hypothetical protein DWQ10_13595, partial [Calditrichaeota bacterium]